MQSLSSIAHYLFDQEKPNLNYASPVKKGTGIINSVRGKMTQLLGPLQVCEGLDKSARPYDINTSRIRDHNLFDVLLAHQIAAIDKMCKMLLMLLRFF